MFRSDTKEAQGTTAASFQINVLRVLRLTGSVMVRGRAGSGKIFKSCCECPKGMLYSSHGIQHGLDGLDVLGHIWQWTQNIT